MKYASSLPNGLTARSGSCAGGSTSRRHHSLGRLSALTELFYPCGEGRDRLPKGIMGKSMNKSDLVVYGLVCQFGGHDMREVDMREVGSTPCPEEGPYHDREEA